MSLVGNMRDDSVGYKPLLLVFWLHQVIPECSLTQLMFQGRSRRLNKVGCLPRVHHLLVYILSIKLMWGIVFPS